MSSEKTAAPRAACSGRSHVVQFPRFGAHMSVAGGLHLAFERGRAAGCDCLQIFVKNQRQWSARPLQQDEVRVWRETRATAKIEPVIAHSSYLINLGNPDDAPWQRSIDALTDELHRCERLEIAGLVLHPGAHLGAGERAGLRRIARALDLIHRRTRGLRVQTLLETTAGQGSTLGHRFEHLGEIIARVREPDRLGICVDTCHVFAAGYDLATEAGYAATLATFGEVVGFDRLRAIHVNDCLHPLGSRRDRHAAIGKGRLGRGAFARVANDPRLAKVPMILETPKGQDVRGRDLDRVNLAALRRLVRKPT